MTFGGLAIAQKYIHQNAQSEKEKFKNFLSMGPHENVWGPSENVSPGPAVALDRPGFICTIIIGSSYNFRFRLTSFFVFQKG